MIAIAIVIVEDTNDDQLDTVDSCFGVRLEGDESHIWETT